MKILDINKHNIKYVGVNTYIANSTSIMTINNFIQLIDLGKNVIPYSDCYPYVWDKSVKTPTTSKGMFLGSVSNIETIINSIINTNNPSTFKTVYFDPSCKYPRYRVSAVSNIKRTRIPEKADSIIIPNIKFDKYVFAAQSSWIIFDDKIILYSKTENCYYLIEFYPTKFSDDKLTKTFNAIINNYKTHGLSKQQEWISILINSGIIPKDVNIFYQGDIILLNDEELTLLNNIYCYPTVTYLEEFDKYISSLLPIPTSADIISLGNMLKSHDQSVVNMGIKLFSSYNIRESLCSLGSLLITNWNNLDCNSIINTANMKYILNVFGFSYRGMNSFTSASLLNKLYNESQNENDRQNCRNLVLQEIKADIDGFITSRTNRYSNFGFQIDVKIN